jgi:membrane-bound serine protease (ClpP class)
MHQGLRFVTARSVLALLPVVGLAAAGTPSQPDSAAESARVFELHIDGEVDPVTAEYIDGGLDQANDSGAALILITMDTPGGLDTSMREIIEHIIASRAPVVVYVSPAGARAASAGYFILLAADVAAMAPATHTGAASPLLAIGGYPVSVDETMEKKIVNDATAYLRSYAARRGRNVALAETAITDAKAFTEREALDGRLCDLIATSREELLAELNGRTVTRFDGRTSQLALAHPVTTTVEMSARQRFLARIVEPDAMFILLLVGVLGLYTEFTHPGMIAPGVLGSIALLLALFAMHILPINLTGVLLLALAIALFILEAKYTSHGVLGAGGAVAMLMGALMVVRSPITGGGVSLGVAIGATLPFAAITLFLMSLVLKSRAWTPQTGVESMVREVGEVAEQIGDGSATDGRRGLVLVRGELWRAAAASAIPKGARVRIVRADGLTLYVEPVDGTPRS